MSSVSKKVVNIAPSTAPFPPAGHQIGPPPREILSVNAYD